MPSLDTNCLLRWLLNDVPAQTARLDALLASEQEFAVPDVALLETVFVLERVAKLDRADVADAIETVLALGTLVIDRELWGELLPLYLAHPKLSAADIYLGIEARRRGRTPLYTFDRKLALQLAVGAPVPGG
ncbi:MAG: PIN domain-containing protein [Bifidobacteriaceae bacterium]|nr:PIN domain-containing protein [Bifidobacteriaceae bacterium]